MCIKLFAVNETLNTCVWNRCTNTYIIEIIAKKNSTFLDWHNVFFFEEIILCKWCEDLYNVIIAYGLRLYVCVIYK